MKEAMRQRKRKNRPRFQADWCCMRSHDRLSAVPSPLGSRRGPLEKRVGDEAPDGSLVNQLDGFDPHLANRRREFLRFLPKHATCSRTRHTPLGGI
jgi:hypothetical protein